MKKSSNFKIKPKILIFILTLFCIGCLVISSVFSGISQTVKNVAGIIIVPLQEGVNNIGGWFNEKSERMKSVEELVEENKKLQKEIDRLVEENSQLAQNKSELNRLRDLYELDKDYTEYEKIGARVIGKDTGNWFNIFTIDKGLDDGIKKDMNVISGGGLVGIVYDVGKNYAKVRTIIDDESSVSVSSADNLDTAIVSGDLTQIEKGYLTITGLRKDATLSKGDMIVTSRISDKFLPGIQVGYVTKIKEDSNKLTKSGKIIPAVDFLHIDEVLVITQLKEKPED